MKECIGFEMKSKDEHKKLNPSTYNDMSNLKDI